MTATGIQDLGRKFGRLTVVSVHRCDGRSYADCVCECGGHCVVMLKSLKSGNTSSCGCLRLERLATACKTHGLADTPIYIVWAGMIARCTNRNRAGWSNYGGRGITVCERWRNSFANFLADMGERPSLKHSIDRINNDGNYEPGNCRWATRTEQNRNASGNRNLAHKGKTQTVAAWAEELGVSRFKIYSRLKRGWTAKAAMEGL